MHKAGACPARPAGTSLSKGADHRSVGESDKGLDDILNAPPSALAGLKHDAALKDLFGTDTVRELGSNKYFALAGVLAALEGKTG